MATKYDFTLDCGVNFYRKLTWTNPDGTAINTTDYTAKMQIRRMVNDIVLVDLSTDGETGGITVSNDGIIEINISAESTKSITNLKGVYDLLIISPTGYVTKLIEGGVTIVREVTQ